jgi:hypothetical protein
MLTRCTALGGGQRCEARLPGRPAKVEVDWVGQCRAFVCDDDSDRVAGASVVVAYAFYLRPNIKYLQRRR